MRQITIRDLEGDLLHRIEELARVEGLSLNKAALRILRKGTGLGPLEAGPLAEDAQRGFVEREALDPRELLDPVQEVSFQVANRDLPHSASSNASRADLQAPRPPS